MIFAFQLHVKSPLSHSSSHFFRLLALFNLNKYLLFEQRDPFVERQKREDEFECDWDRFACVDYNRLAMEEEVREEEAMEIDWVTVDEDEQAHNDAMQDAMGSTGASASEAPF